MAHLISSDREDVISTFLANAPFWSRSGNVLSCPTHGQSVNLSTLPWVMPDAVNVTAAGTMIAAYDGVNSWMIHPLTGRPENLGSWGSITCNWGMLTSSSVSFPNLLEPLADTRWYGGIDNIPPYGVIMGRIANHYPAWIMARECSENPQNKYVSFYRFYEIRNSRAIMGWNGYEPITIANMNAWPTDPSVEGSDLIHSFPFQINLPTLFPGDIIQFRFLNSPLPGQFTSTPEDPTIATVGIFSSTFSMPFPCTVSPPPSAGGYDLPVTVTITYTGSQLYGRTTLSRSFTIYTAGTIEWLSSSVQSMQVRVSIVVEHKRAGVIRAAWAVGHDFTIQKRIGS